MQGMIGDVDFLVTCPINQFARAVVALERPRGQEFSPAVQGVDHLPKTKQAVANALAWLTSRSIVDEVNAQVLMTNPIPAGKGMGSSSADLAAAVWATAMAAGVEMEPADVARIALSVEPTDAVMFPGVALFDHRHGKIAETLGMPPPMEVIVVDRGGEIDTLEFNSIDRSDHWRSVSDATAEALELVREGILRGDPALVGKGATISAKTGCPTGSSQLIEQAVDFCGRVGGVGVNAAHSGTVAGILLDARKRHSKPVLRRAREEFSTCCFVEHFRVIGGGVRPDATGASGR